MYVTCLLNLKVVGLSIAFQEIEPKAHLKTDNAASILREDVSVSVEIKYEFFKVPLFTVH